MCPSICLILPMDWTAMSKAFDPYHQWLGIPPHEQPPNHYRLLSLQLYEPNPDVIQNAVDRIMTHLRTFQTGERSRESQELLTQVARAKICLLDPVKRAKYDRALRAQLEIAVEADSGALSSGQSDSAESSGKSLAVQAIRRGTAYFGWQSRRVQVVGISIALLLLLLVVAVALQPFFRPDDGSAPDGPDGKGVVAIDETTSAGTPDFPPDKGAVGTQVPPTNLDGESTEGEKQPREKMVKPLDAKASGKPVVPAPEQKKQGDGAGSVVPPKPVDPLARRQIDAAFGLISDRMAMCQSLKLDSLDVLAQSMGTAGYRPIRVRPYLADGQVLLDAVWLRDSAPWQLERRASARELAEVTNELNKQQFQPVDVAGVDDGNMTHYLALFVKNAEPTRLTRLWFDKLTRADEEMPADAPGQDYALVSMHVFIDRDGAERACQLWQQVGTSQAPNWFQTTGLVRPNQPLFADLSRPVDLALVAMRKAPDTPEELTCYTVANRTALQTAVLAGYDLEQHREECRKLIDSGYLMTGLSVAPLGTETIAASIWRFARDEVPADIPLLVQHNGPLPTITALPEEPTPKPVVVKAEVPSGDVLKKASRKLQSQFSLLVSAANNVNGRVVFARTLLDAAKSETDSALCYAELERARELGIQAGQVNIALTAAARLGALYKTDRLQLYAETTKKLLSNLKLPIGRRILAAAAFDLSDQARLNDQFAIAEQLAATAGNASRTFRDKRLVRAAGEQKRRIGFARSLASAANMARQSLVQDPNDPVANLNLGKYVCFLENDWSTGLTMLTKSGDVNLVQLASDDLAGPTEPGKQMVVADSWFDWAEQQSQESQIGAWQRAFQWYSKALSGLSASSRKKANKKLSDIQAKLMPWLCTTTRWLPWVDGKPGVLQSIHAGSARIWSMSVGQSGRIVIAGLDSGEMVVWDLASGNELSRNTTLFRRRASVALAGDSQVAACAGDGRNLGLWNLANGNLSRLAQTERVICVIGSKRHPIYALGLTRPDKGNVAVWNTGGRQQRVNCPGSPVALALSPDGQTLLVGTDRPQLVAFDLGAGKQTSATLLPEIPMRLEFSADGRYVVVTFDQSIHVLDALDGKAVLNITTNRACAALLSGASRLIIGGRTVRRDTQLEVTDLVSGKVTFSGSPIPNVNPGDICRVVAMSAPRAILVGDTGGNIYLVRLPDTSDLSAPVQRALPPSRP